MARIRLQERRNVESKLKMRNHKVPINLGDAPILKKNKNSSSTEVKHQIFITLLIKKDQTKKVMATLTSFHSLNKLQELYVIMHIRHYNII